MIVGAAILGASAATAVVAQTAGVHALTAGAIGTMVLGVMSRVCRGHTGRPLTTDKLTNLVFLLVNLAALARVTAALLPGASARWLEVSALLWIAAFVLFAFWSAPIVLRPRSDQPLSRGT